MKSKIENIRSKDPLDILIFEKGLRIKSVISDKELDLMVLILTNGKIIKTKVSGIQLFNNASQKELDNWKLVGGGVGLHWEDLDEDLSLKGFIKETAITNIVRQLQEKGTTELLLM
ncbi:MAG: DUF2442 domain-containing protein [Bacteroidales bacterium]